MREAKAAYDAARDSGNSETEIYDHLYRFFERYYDKGDFMSRRYYARESASRAAPFAVPYDGREVYLHWANKDQYYIKSSEYLTHFTFDLREAIRKEAAAGNKAAAGQADALESAADVDALKVHFRIVDGHEGEHGNVKEANDKKRVFTPHAARPAEVSDSGELVLNFEYKALPGGQYDRDEAAIKAEYGNINKGDMAEYAMADTFLAAIDALGDALPAAYAQHLRALAPTDKQKKRPLLVKYLQKYTARSTMDYFIHKDLGGFLKRELDFYIKNEIMQLDDIDHADAPQVESYLAKVKVLRRIAHPLIDFLAQLENFQKKLWLKKKFVTETNYGITLDRVPEALYPEIAACDAQRREWCELFHIEDIEGDLHKPAYSEPLTVEFLKANPFLVLDTAFFDEAFKARLANEIDGLDEQCDGLLVHSENFQALSALQKRYEAQVNSIYIDPPYNTGDDGFPYKDAYKHSSWMTMIDDRIRSAKKFLKRDGLFISSIDRDENRNYLPLLFSVFSEQGFIEECVWQKAYGGGFKTKHINNIHEYVHVFSNDKDCIPRLEGPPNPEITKYYKFEDNKLEVRGRYRLQPLNSNSNDYRQNLSFPIPIPNAALFGKKEWQDEFAIIREKLKDSSLSLIDYGESPDKRWHFKADDNDWDGDLIYPPRQWQWSWHRLRKALINEDIYIEWSDGEWSVSYKQYRCDENGIERGTKPPSLLVGPYTQTGTDELRALFNAEVAKFIKPSALVGRFLSIDYKDANALFLDYFAGSGTTGDAVISLNRLEPGSSRRYVLVEMENEFDTVLKPRIAKVVYSENWKNGKPVPLSDKEKQSADNPYNGISHCFKYIRLESYEDALNNLVLRDDASRDTAVEKNANLRRDYLLNYFLDVETQGSQSLLNIDAFRDPTAYRMTIKQPGSDESREQTIDLVETFNWLIGLWVEHLAAPQTFAGTFVREQDKDLPDDHNTRLACTRLKPDADGDYWFRLVEGYTLKVPGDTESRSPALVIWRKLTDDAQADNAALQKYLETIGVSTRERVYDTIYVNGSHTLPNPVVTGEQTRVRLLEEAFHDAMWAQAD